MLKPFVLICLCMLTACVQPGVEELSVRESDAASVAGCTELGRVETVPGVYGPLAELGLKDAKNTALRAAARRGATNIVFDPVAPGEPQYRVSGTAYKC